MTTHAFWVGFVTLVVLDVCKHAAILCLGPAPIWWDATEYFAFGESVSQGDWLLLTHQVNYRMPGYAWFLGPHMLLGPYALLSIVVVQHVICFLTSLLTAGLCGRITNSKPAMLAAYSLCVLSVSKPWFANTVLNETLFAFFLTTVWWLWFEYLRGPSKRLAIGLACGLALTILIRPIAQLLWVPILFTIYGNTWQTKGQIRGLEALKHSLLFVAVLAALLTPWLCRNAYMFGDVFLARLPAENKWQVCFQEGASANLPIPETASGRKLRSLLDSCGHDPHELYCYSVTESLQKCKLSRVEVDAIVSDLCWEAIRAAPVQFSLATLKRAINFWRCRRNVFPPWAAGEPSTHSDQFTWRIPNVAYFARAAVSNSLSENLRFNEILLCLIAFGCGTLVLNPATRLFGLGLILSFVYFSLITAAVEIENYRYRMVLEPAMITAVVAGVYFWQKGTARGTASNSV